MKSKFLGEFKKFAMRGNVVDLAVGIIIGGAFGKIITSVVSDIIMPPIGLLIGGVNFTDLRLTLKAAKIGEGGAAIPAVTVNYGAFLQNIIDFVIVALAIFLLIKLINQLNHKQKEKEEAEAAALAAKPSKDVELLTEIRDLLKKQ